MLYRKTPLKRGYCCKVAAGIVPMVLIKKQEQKISDYKTLIIIKQNGYLSQKFRITIFKSYHRSDIRYP
jgi:hypothetical protein